MKNRKLTIFYWQGVDQSGFRVCGEEYANNIAAVKLRLRQDGIVATQIKKYFSLWVLNFYKQIKATDIVYFSREIAALLNAGIPLATALEIIIKSTNKLMMRALIRSLKIAIESGNTLHNSLSQYPQYFDELFCSLIYAGETSGNLESMLTHIANHKEKNTALKKRIKRALIYPALVTIMTIIVTTIMLIFLVPQFASLFHAFNAQLPLLTRIVIQVAEKLRQVGAIGLIIIVFLSLVIYKLIQHYPYLQQLKAKFVLKLPLVGTLLTTAIWARCFYTLAITLQAGIPVLDALHAAATTTGNILYQQAIITVSQQIGLGQSLHIAIKNTGLFPERAIQLIAIGEASGTLEKMLLKLVDHFSEQVDNATGMLTQLLEPAIMIILCTLAGIIIISMYLPIFNLGTIL